MVLRACPTGVPEAAGTEAGFAALPASADGAGRGSAASWEAWATMAAAKRQTILRLALSMPNASTRRYRGILWSPRRYAPILGRSVENPHGDEHMLARASRKE